ncbi:MAG: 2-amino-4-hydroxy-6-hydroxymethyldihydropteridine diphosphokinase [Candidatus Cloacimonetes bacterium]|nr:2-amino-4-hydroxy-6-hydroxymethyldihydropteridine diphosphokinase [Candidatus Cloacimonadota bacterium]
MLCYLGIGANLGEREENITQAVQELNNSGEIRVLRQAAIRETLPYGNTNQPMFLNTVTEIETEISAQQLLALCLQIETRMGRRRRQHWEPRIIDIDILFYGDEIIKSDDLVIPHPDLQNRKFVLDSLLELCPHWQHPVLKKSIADIAAMVK